MTPEARVLAEVRLALSEAGVLVLRNQVGRLEDKTGRWVGFGLGVGSPDLVVFEDGYVMGLEVKRPASDRVTWENQHGKGRDRGGEVSAEQVQCARMWLRYGVRTYVVRSAAEALTALATERERRCRP